MERKNIEINSYEEINFKDDIINLINIIMDYYNIHNIMFVSISFSSSEEIIDLNFEYRNKNTDTDVLSFEYYDQLYKNPPKEDEILNLGDIFISYEYTQNQAKSLNHSFKEEALFLVLHAMLHLLGYDHLNNEEEKEMIEQQKVLFKKFKG